MGPTRRQRASDGTAVAARRGISSPSSESVIRIDSASSACRLDSCSRSNSPWRVVASDVTGGFTTGSLNHDACSRSTSATILSLTAIRSPVTGARPRTHAFTGCSGCWTGAISTCQPTKELAKANGRDIMTRSDQPITKGLQERIHQVVKLDEAIELQPILDRLAEAPQLDLATDDDTDQRRVSGE